MNPRGLGTLFAQARRVGGSGSGGTVSRNFFLLEVGASIVAGVPRRGDDFTVCHRFTRS
jgi:hypothetical protein